MAAPRSRWSCRARSSVLRYKGRTGKASACGYQCGRSSRRLLVAYGLVDRPDRNSTARFDARGTHGGNGCFVPICCRISYIHVDVITMHDLKAWHLLVLTLPTETATARMRFWRALKSMGCAV